MKDPYTYDDGITLKNKPRHLQESHHGVEK